MGALVPLRIDFFLASAPTITTHPQHLDGILARAVVERENRREPGAGDQNWRTLIEDLPLERLYRPNSTDLWCWRASQISFAPGPRAQESWTRPYRIQEILADQGERFAPLRRDKWGPEQASGPNKSYLLGTPVRITDRAQAWAVADRERLEALLEHVENLGPHGRLGHGKILNIQVSEDERALELSMKRHVPFPYGNDYLPLHGAFRPPYWDRSSFTEVWAPKSPLIFLGEIKTKEVPA